MPFTTPTVEQIEDYLESLEELLLSSLQAATPDLPRVSETVQRLWEDVSRFGPQSLPPLPNVRIPGLGAFEVPPPPPPPPPSIPSSYFPVGWVNEHPWTSLGISATVVGAGLLAGYGFRHNHARTARVRTSTGSDRRQVVVVLGGDSPSGLALILDLERNGYIVIASVTTPNAVVEVEQRSHGYVRALVLDPSHPETIPYFLRSLSATMSRRFPISSAGDPHASPSAHSYIHSVISLLTLPPPSATPPPAPFEHLSLSDTYAAYLQTTHLTPLQILQAILPLLRTSPARAQDSLSNKLARKSILICVPATDARVGVAFASAQAMSAAATLRGVEILRREIRMAALTDTSESMKNIKVVVVDVGAVGNRDSSQEPTYDLHQSMDRWTPSEKVAYGTAFASVVEGGMQYTTHRKPSDIAVFVNAIVDIVNDGQRIFISTTGAAFRIGLGRIREWVLGDRIAVGAGARTYVLASHLPTVILDAILSIPHLLISIRNALLPVPPRIVAPAPHSRSPLASSLAPENIEQGRGAPKGLGERGNDHMSETGSEADVESNEGYSSGPLMIIGISLWLVPAVSQALKIKRLMRLKPASIKSPSSFVDFEPHITLASVPTSCNLDDLRSAIPPTQTVIPIEFKSLDVGQKYFMSVYASVHDIGGLAALRSRLRESLGQNAVPAIAHLSLYYIDDADQDERSRIAELLRRSEGVIHYYEFGAKNTWYATIRYATSQKSRMVEIQE
ncbi:hypothetical protein WOLCODRAFT_87586 [Wolfiporia cocos MD-104 SS10]|uniref:Uncharacterized protein n=1 Tax=Wolfiporia cocos (strain MD-104) TaxID=742152 RepID=A0A2H3JJ27_WOLCO|nr:hypothetical protein WOLCODRAFT_87586 [Wolfiporia cocos MD-104 SS10]